MNNLKYIFDEVTAERVKQNEKWGEQNHPSLHPAAANGAEQLLVINNLDEKGIKELVDDDAKNGNSNWVNISMEEFKESICAPTDYERRNELIQTIAVLVQWIECLDRNNRCKVPEIPKFTDQSIMPFGMYKGFAMANVPAKYLLWLLAENMLYAGPLKDYVESNKEDLEKEVENLL